MKNELVKKIDNIHIVLSKIGNKKELYNLILPFLSEDSQKNILNHTLSLSAYFSGYTIYIQNSDELEAFTKVLRSIDGYKLKTIYDRIYFDDDPFYSEAKEKFISVDDLFSIPIDFKEMKQNKNRKFNFLNDFAISPDGSYIAMATERDIFLWSAKDYTFLALHRMWDSHSEKIYFTPNSKHMISLLCDAGSWQYVIQIWEPLAESSTEWIWIEDEEYGEYEHDESEANPLIYLYDSLLPTNKAEVYSPDFKYMLRYEKKNLDIYSTNNNSFKDDFILLKELKISSKINTLSLSHNTQYLAIGVEEDIEIFSMESFNLLKILESHTKEIISIAMSRDNKYMATSSKDNSIKLWSLVSFELLGTIEKASKEKILKVDFSTDSTQILAIADGGIKVWNIEYLELVNAMYTDADRWLLADGDDNIVRKGKVPEQD